MTERMVLPARSTRGRRVNELLGEEKQFDEFFWSQDIFKDAGEDADYEIESDHGDKFDADFWEEEPESDENDTTDDYKEKETSQRSLRKKKPQLKFVQKLPPVKKKPSKSLKYPVLNQQQMLEEAAITEMYNSYSLSLLMQIEENKSQKESFESNPMQYPRVKLTDSIKSGARNVKLFTEQALDFSKPKVPNTDFCAVTGNPAKYRDPLTGLPYSDLESFKIIRERYHLQQEEAILQEITDLKSQLKKLS
jgi:vacuolar protein sorting-associated protein 72